MTTMQKIIKHLAIAFGFCLIFAIIGGIASVIGAVGGITAWFHDGDEEVQVENIEASFGPFSDSVDRLEMEIGAADIQILLGDELYVETDNPYITAEEKNGRLVIKESSHVGDLDGSTLIVYIPREMEFEHVDMVTGAGRIDLNALTCRELEWEMGAGMAQMKDLTVTEKADIDGGAGQIVVHSGSIHDLDFDMGVGEAELCLELTGTAEMTAGIGELVLTVPAALEDYTVHAEQGIGQIEVAGMDITGRGTLGDGPNRLELEGGIGNISVYFEP